MRFIASLSALIVPATLLIAFLEHIARPARLSHALRSQRVLARRAVRPVAAIVVAAEVVLGVAGAFLVVVGREHVQPLRASLAASAVLLLLYSGYSLFLTRARPAVPCGCSGTDTEVSGWVVGRALLLAVLAAVGSAFADRMVFPDESMQRFTIALLAATTFALVLWHLPDAMHDPLRTALRQRRQELLTSGGKVSRA